MQGGHGKGAQNPAKKQDQAHPPATELGEMNSPKAGIELGRQGHELEVPSVFGVAAGSLSFFSRRAAAAFMERTRIRLIRR